MAPMLLGYILGGMLEENLSRALVIYDDSYSFLWERPLTFSIISIAVLTLVVPVLIGEWKKRWPKNMKNALGD
jgi:putative tricarboxylic transport membrane protein